MDPIKTKKSAFVKIIEQPASKGLRFRYECEGRSAGSIPGVGSTQDNKTFPTIQVVGYTGKAVVVVSCVTNDAPHKPHPHNLVGKEGCKRGVCTIHMNDDMTASFPNLGIQCVKKKDIDESLTQRQQIRVDPFQSRLSICMSKFFSNICNISYLQPGSHTRLVLRTLILTVSGWHFKSFLREMKKEHSHLP